MLAEVKGTMSELTTEIRFGKEQAMLADIANRFFRDKYPIEAAREQLTTENGFDADLWAEMVDVGWLGLVVPEDLGGTGLGMVELATLVEPMGRQLFASPFFSTQLVIQALLGAGTAEPAQALGRKWLPRLSEGAAATWAAVEEDGSWVLERCRSTAEIDGSSVRLSGDKRFVLDAGVADLIAVTVMLDGSPAVALVEKEQVVGTSLEREIVVDETRRCYRLKLDGIEIGESSLLVGEAATGALEAVRNAALLLISAEACGGIAGALDRVVEYLKSRLQFDRPIGSYQALKHPTVDILIGLERSRSHLYHAASVFGSPEAEPALRMLKVESSESFAFAGDRAVQFHGGLGFTYECDAQLYLRRALWCQYQFGDAVHHRQALAALLL